MDGWRVQHIVREGGREEWRAYGPLRADEEEAIRDAEYASMRGALDVHPSNLPTVIDVLFDVLVLETERTAEQERAEQAERERDELEARVRELEAALRAIVAIDSASPEHRIAMRALGDSAVSTPRLRRGAAGARCNRCGHYETSYDRAESLYAHCPSCSRHTRWERVDESDIIAAGRRGDS